MWRLLAVLAVICIGRPLSAQRVEDARLGIGRAEVVVTHGVVALPGNPACTAHRTKTTLAGAVVVGGLGYVLGGFAYGMDDTPGRSAGNTVRFALECAAAGAVLGFIVGSTSTLCD